MRYFVGIILLLWCSVIAAQNAETDSLRALAYQSRLMGDDATAINFYSLILQTDSADYDARLALARLYLKKESVDTALDLFAYTYKDDPSDVEALNGLGECHLLQGNNDSAIRCFERALLFLPGDVQQRLYLARALGLSDRIDEAILQYEKINETDPTYAESWAGMGKMYYWKGLPFSADRCYQKALALDPSNEIIKKEYDNLQEEVKFNVSLKVRPLKEIEENYEISAITSSLKLEKRLNDYFHLEGNILVDYSNRVFDNNIGDTTRWYNNAWVKGSLMLNDHKLSVYAGYSASDNTLTPLGFSWLYSGKIGKLSIKNTLGGGYDYFYYWNRVGSTSASEELSLGLGIFKLGTRYSFGVVDPVLIKDILHDTAYVDRNEFQSAGVSLNVKVMSIPMISLGLNYSYMNYEYKSPMYYSPFGRNHTGASVSLYHKMKKFFIYGYYSYNIGDEYNYELINEAYEKVYLNVDNWSTDIELGYQFNPFSVSTGYSRFYNPYYQSSSLFVNIKALF